MKGYYNFKELNKLPISNLYLACLRTSLKPSEKRKACRELLNVNRRLTDKMSEETLKVILDGIDVAEEIKPTIICKTNDGNFIDLMTNEIIDEKVIITNKVPFSEYWNSFCFIEYEGKFLLMTPDDSLFLEYVNNAVAKMAGVFII